MDYIIEIDVWNLGYDEADELMDAIGDVLVSRGLGTDPDNEDSDVRSIVALKPQGTERMDASTSAGAKRVLRRFARDARLVMIPGTNFKRSRS